MIRNRAACLLALNEKDEILVVTRRFEDNFGLPGGKVDPGESEEIALIREIEEETGIVLEQKDLITLYTATIPPGTDGRAFWTTTFLCTKTDLQPKQMEEGILPLWVDLPTFLGDKNTFKKYNVKVLDAYQELKYNLELQDSDVPTV